MAPPIELAVPAISSSGAGPAPIAIPGIIMFVFADLASFLLFFLVYMADRAERPTLFLVAEQQTNVALGLANAIILISSGALVAAAVARARRDDLAGAARHVRWAITVGALFTAVKGWEYYEKLSADINPYTSAFFTYYYVLTGLHFVHYAVGMAALVVVRRQLLRASEQHFVWLQSSALYWHMVDIIWIFLFPIFYLQGAR